MSFIVGLTGGIGSGKTAAAEFFAQLGVPVIDADVIARDVVQIGSNAHQAISKRFGKEVLQKDGSLNRPHLRQIIFADPAQKKWLETLLHPLIYQEIKQKISEVNYPYCIVIIPLLFEHLALFGNLIDHVLVIEASLDTRIKRIMQRDSCSISAAHNIIQQQASSDQRQQIAHSTINNDSTLIALKEKIFELHQVFLKKATPLS